MVPRHRVVQLMIAGLVDSLCLSFAWTVLLLQIVSHYGLSAAGLVSAAMLGGVALSAPAASRLACLVDGRRLLRSAASAEALLRVAVFALLITGAPLLALAVCVSLMNVTAWTGYAGMRAEVAAASPETSALTWYGAGIAGIEAIGAAAAALLPLVADVGSTKVMVTVTGTYVLGLVPTVVVAGGSPIKRSGPRGLGVPRRHVAGQGDKDTVPATWTGPSARSRTRGSWRPSASLPVAAGVLLMFVASGPTLLSVGLAAELHGRASVALVAVSFTVGSLAAPFISSHAQRRRANAPAVWLLCALGMTVGWVLAPWSIALMMLAQAASGGFMTALEGLLDTSIAAGAGAGATGALARGTAGRALGSAAALVVLPTAVSQVGLTSTAVVVVGLLGGAWLVVRPRTAQGAGARRSPQPESAPTPARTGVAEWVGGAPILGAVMFKSSVEGRSSTRVSGPRGRRG